MPTLSLRESCDQKLNGLENERRSWWNHWRQLADYILPRRYRWLITPNEMNRGAPINDRILDSTGTVAVRTLAAGMMSGITSPTRPWFKLRIEGVDSDETTPGALWLSACEKKMMRVFQESNFYNSIAIVYLDLAVFGTAPQLIYEDFDKVIACFNPCAGEYYVANSPNLQVDTFYRKITMTVSQIVAKWGLDNCSTNVKSLYEGGGAQLVQEIIIAHAIEPNEPRYSEIPSTYKFREVYWEWGSSRVKENGEAIYLDCRGFHEAPFICPRWDLTGNDAYGRSPAMDALGDIKQLQQETRRKAQALDKMVNPPLLADIQLKNQPASLLPGGVTYISGLDKSAHAGMRPVYTVMPPVREIMEDITEVQRRIQNIFFNDLFMMFQQLQAEPRSAAAVDARREEKLVMLGPVLERFQHEGLDPAIDRVFNIMLRGKLLPPPPPEIQGLPIQIVYVSMLAEAQRAVATAGIERLYAFAGNMAAVKPDIMDKLDSDQTIDVYGSAMAVDPTIIRSDETVAQIRADRAKQQQADRELAITQEGVNAAKTLSETEVGGGKNALQAMLQ